PGRTSSPDSGRRPPKQWVARRAPGVSLSRPRTAINSQQAPPADDGSTGIRPLSARMYHQGDRRSGRDQACSGDDHGLSAVSPTTVSQARLTAIKRAFRLAVLAFDFGMTARNAVPVHYVNLLAVSWRVLSPLTTDWGEACGACR